jgi:sulfur carrier protein ThiS
MVDREMIQIKIHLHGVLRDYLPPANKGKTTLSLPKGATLAYLLATLQIESGYLSMVNNQEITDIEHLLQDGDEVQLLTIIGGG